MDMTEEELEDLALDNLAAINFFRDKKANLYFKMERHMETIAYAQIEIDELEKQIEEARPRTEYGEKICPRCDCMSMEYTETAPSGEDDYKCEMCYHEEYYD